MPPVLNSSELLTALNWLDTCQPEMVAHIERLCNINSGTQNLSGIAEVQRQLESLYQCLGGELSYHDSQPLSHVNDAGNLDLTPLGRTMVFSKHIAVRPRALLCIHCDTVYDQQHPFQACRWLDSQRLNGPGVIDAKGGLIVMLYALRALEQSRWAGKLGWQVIINPDEEIGSPGSGSLLRSLAQQADLGLLFEPSLPDGSMVSWRKGSGNFVFVVRGKAAHSGRAFHDGRNAIVALCQLLNQVNELNGRDPDITLNVGRISGGGALNIVPDLAIGRVNARVKSVEQAAWVQQQFQAITEIASNADGITVTLHGEFTSPPKPVDEGTLRLQSVIERCGTELGVPVAWQGSGGASDGNKFAAAGLSNIDSLGPAGGEIHSANEFLLVDSLVPRTKLAAATLLQLAANQTWYG